jgi:hypothetical protein
MYISHIWPNVCIQHMCPVIGYLHLMLAGREILGEDMSLLHKLLWTESSNDPRSESPMYNKLVRAC